MTKEKLKGTFERILYIIAILVSVVCIYFAVYWVVLTLVLFGWKQALYFAIILFIPIGCFLWSVLNEVKRERYKKSTKN